MSNKDRSSPEYFDIPKTVKISDQMLEALQQRKIETGVAIGTQMRRAVQEAITKSSEVLKEKSLPVPLLGYIPGGPAQEVRKTAPGSYVTPPFKLNPDCYALIVVGDSMESEFGISIPDGSYAFFCPDLHAPYGGIVHVEWEGAGDDNETTLKRYCPQPDGTVIFEPLNKKHKPFSKKEGEFEIRGVFVRAWDGK